MTKDQSIYTAEVTRDGRWWMIHVLEIDGLTQARRYSDVLKMARELIGVALGKPSDAIIVEVHLGPVGGLEISSVIRQIEADKAARGEIDERLRRETRQVAQELAAAEVPVRDIGGILGVSHQRAQQLVNS